MSRVPSLSSPFLLGFDEIERALDRVVKGADGYPPYNIERCDRANGQPAFACYLSQPGGGYVLAGVHVVTLDGAAIAHAISFLQPGLGERLGLPAAPTD